jgi:hypothetical protein
VVLVSQPQQPRPQERPSREVEGTERLLFGQPPRCCLPLAGWQRHQIEEGQRDVAGWADHLDRAPVDRPERGSQRLVAPRHLGQTPL